MNFRDIIERLRDCEFCDFYPLNKKQYTLQNVLINSGIYIAAVLVCILLVGFLGGIFILGIIVKIISFVVGIYALIGLVVTLLNYMKYN